MEDLGSFLEAHFRLPMAWPLALGAALLMALILTLAYRPLFRRLGRLARFTGTDLDDLFLERMRLPAKGLILLLSMHLFVALRSIENATASKVIEITELLLIAYLVVEALETAVLDYWLRERKKVPLPAIVRHLLLVVVYSVVILSIVAGVTGVNIVPILATSTVITVVLGLALQDTLGNLFSGLALSLERPFSDGDWILVDGLEGQVVHTGWRSTHLRTFSWDIVAIPNSVIARARVQNFSTPDPVTARNLDVPVPPSSQPAIVEAAIRAALGKIPAIRAEPPAKVWFVSATPLFARYVVKFWIGDFQAHDDIESDLFKVLHQELAARGVALGGDPRSAALPVDGAPAALARS